jgi:hypothetical protein
MPTAVPIKPMSKNAILGGMVIDVQLWQQGRSLQTEIALPHEREADLFGRSNPDRNQLFQHQQNEGNKDLLG